MPTRAVSSRPQRPARGHAPPRRPQPVALGRPHGRASRLPARGGTVALDGADDQSGPKMGSHLLDGAVRSGELGADECRRCVQDAARSDLLGAHLGRECRCNLVALASWLGCVLRRAAPRLNVRSDSRLPAVRNASSPRVGSCASLSELLLGEVGREVRSDAPRRLLHLPSPDAGGADVDTCWRSGDECADALDVRIPASLRAPMGVRDVHPEVRLLAANLTNRCHDAPTSSQIATC